MATCSLANPSIPLPAGYKQANPGMVQSHTAELCLAAPPVVTSTLETAQTWVLQPRSAEQHSCACVMTALRDSRGTTGALFSIVLPP